ncbi:MAG: hypothetical protein HC912_03305 [Saprospiraceae bacterium]|nr:hypothetical protein [Saprospiraceae bacterium]
MKKLITLVACSFFFSSVFAQLTFQPRKLSNTKKGVIYDKEFAAEFRLQTNGWGMGLQWGDIRTYYLTRFYYVGLGELKHTREFRSNMAGFGTRSYIFGKQNNFFQIKGGVGEKRYFTERADRKGLGVGISYRVGPTLGLLKPYQLDISSSEGSSLFGFQTRSIRYTSQNADEFLDKNRIVGSSGFSSGLDNLSVVAGANAMVALHLDFGAFEEFVKAVDVGIMLDFFLQPVPVMVESAQLDNVKNRPYFLNIFVNFQFGKRS